ncbi:3'-5' exoribonuclease [Tardiphaga alba]|uniref:3'-5' exoribonuclease n=1 Tax=Tardiphaga alba TaxID=340268 RepID=A0ABX8ABE4_9BRAD|nr:3'-5' exoribonuclease [Tardiphaga alba]QUS40552.1 3'-5' exoribonuclease [Tardiphaga alba]
MRIWFDTEFIEDGKTIDLLSIGLVREDGASLYIENADCDRSKASDWVKENVIVHLHPRPVFGRDDIARQIVEFVGDKPQFWAYYADYDWVALCQLFGTMMDLPKGWPMYCRDVKQLCDEIGNPELPKQSSTEHHALADAMWTKQAWEFLAHQTVRVDH